MPQRHWLLKTEPESYSIDDLARDGKTGWTGVRNYQARNFMRDDMKRGDLVLIYHSGTEPPGVVGIAKVSRESHADPTASDRGDGHYDAKSKKVAPTWMMVEIEFVRKLPRLVALEELKSARALRNLLVIKRGQRLSVQPVDAKDFETIVKMASP
jgi:predicted RNA-binding protein with PUA-like domain